MGTWRAAVIALGAAAVLLAGCSAARQAAAAGQSRAPGGGASRTVTAYDDANACTAFSDALNGGVPPAIEASYASQYGQPLSTDDFVTDAAYNADPHLQALVQQWRDAGDSSPAEPGYFEALGKAENAVKTWCAKQGSPVHSG